MGHELYRLIRDGAPPERTPNMRLLAETIADDALDPSQHTPADGGWPRSAIRVRGGRSRSDGTWYDGLTERTGMTERVISRTLTALARADYEMREQVGTDRRGRPVFAYPGRTPRFRVPPLKPRGSPPATASFGSPPATATFGSQPDTATSEARQGRPPSEARQGRPPRKVAENGDLGSPPDSASKVARFGELQTLLPNPSNPTSPDLQVANSYLEGDRPATATDDDDDFDSSRRPRPGPGYGLCPECGDWAVVKVGGGRLAKHNRGTGRSWSWCPGSRQAPAEPVPCTRCGRADVALSGYGICRACQRAAYLAAERGAGP